MATVATVSLLALLAWILSAPPSPEAGGETLVGRIEHSMKSRLRFVWRRVSGGKPTPAILQYKWERRTSSAKLAKSRVTLSVTDDRLRPIKDAEVLFENLDVLSRPIHFKSDAKGAASGSLDAGNYQLTILHPKYASYVAAPVNVTLERSLEIYVRLVAAANVAGAVVDEDAQPLAGVHVSAERRRVEHLTTGGNTYVNNAGYPAQDTDSSGTFTLPHVAQGPNRFIFSLDGYATVEREIELPAGGLPQPLKITMTRPASISGQIVDEEQKPVTSATIKIIATRRYGEPEAQSSSTLSTVSSTSGSFVLKHLLQTAMYDIRMDHPRYATAIFAAVPANSHDGVWMLERGGRIEGRALFIDRPTTAAAALLQAQTVLQGTTFTREVVTSGDDGAWNFEHLPYGSYKLSLRDERLAMEPKPALNCAKDRPTTNVLVEVYQCVPLAGKAIDAATGYGIDGAKVTAHATYGYLLTKSRDFTATADEHGDFELPRLPSGQHSLVGKAEGYLSSDAGGAYLSVTLQRGDHPDELVIPMSRGGSVEGYVRDAEGDAMADARVQLFAASTTLQSFAVKDLHTITDGAGRFFIRGFPLGERVQLFASAAKAGYAKARSPLIDLSAQRPNGVTAITLTAGGVVTGKVMDTGGRQLSQAKVTFESREFLGDPSSSSFSALTGADGMYLLEHCTAGAMRVTAARENFVTLVKSGTVKEAVVLSRFDFKLQSGNKIAGVVADFHGRPIAGAKVAATPLEKATGTNSAVTDKKGQFTISNLSTGFFRIEASFPLTTGDGKQQYTFIAPRVASGNLTLPIDCDVEPSASGDVIGEEGKGIDRFHVSVRSRLDANPPQDFRFTIDRSLSSARGHFRLLQIPRGLYTLEIKADGYEPYRSDDIIIGPGLHTDLPSIRLNTATGINGSVLSRTTGKPVSNVTVRVLDTAKPEIVTVNRLELAAYSRQDVVEWLDAYYDTNADLDPNWQFRPVARVRANVSATGKTDYSGRFSVKGTAPGQYTLEFEHPSYSVLRLDRVAVTKTEATDVGEVQLQPGGELHGQVLDGMGRPIYSATVLVRNERTGRNTTRTDLGGNYLFRGIAPGRRTVVVRATVGARVVYAFGFAEVREDETTAYNFVLSLDANVQGTLVSPDVPARSGTVRLFPLDENDAPVTDIHYDGTARGTEFSINGIPGGRYVAIATGSTGGGGFALWQHVDVQRGDNPIGLQIGSALLSAVTVNAAGTVAPGTKIQLRPDPSAIPLPGSLYALLVRSATSSSTGKFTIPYLLPGSYTVSCSSAANPAAAEIGVLSFQPGQRVINYRLAVP